MISDAELTAIQTHFNHAYPLPVTRVLPDGSADYHGDSNGDETIVNVPALRHARARGVTEAVRWGQPSVIFLMPAALTWIAPVVRGDETLGGLTSGPVMIDEDRVDRFETVNYLAAQGIDRARARRFVERLPVWTDRARISAAAEHLFAATCSVLPWEMTLLVENRSRALRQREIAEEIHRRKRAHADTPLVAEERILLSLIRAGDQRAARRELHRTLGAIFSHTADTNLIKAHVIEMMGFLVRSALEESPSMATLIERNHTWMSAIIEARDFEALTDVTAAALDDFMRNVFLHSHVTANGAAGRVLDYLTNNYHRPIAIDTLAALVGLSRSRLTHLVKEVTGKSVSHHVRELRIREAQRLLEESTLDCADIAYEVGYSDQSHFTRQFRRTIGITPGAYRRRCRRADRRWAAQ